MMKLLLSAKNRNFQRLWWAQLISQFGDRINQLALVGLIAERAPGSPMGLAKLLAFTIIPVFIVQPFAGAFVDRWDRRKTLFICDLFRGVLVLTIPFVFMLKDAMLPIYIVVFCVFCFSRFYVPAKMSIIPDIVDEDSLLMANSLVSTTGMIAFVLGCALGGFLIDWFGARTGFIIDAATFFVSGSIVFTMTTSFSMKLTRQDLIATGKELVGTIKKSIWVEMREGLHYLITQKDIRFIINMLFVLLAAAGAVYVVTITFIQQVFHSITKHVGLLAVALGVGLFIGALLYGRFGKKIVWYKLVPMCLVAGGCMLAFFAVMVTVYPNIIMAMFLAFFLGLVIGPVFIVSNTVVHMVSDESMRGKVFSALEIVIHFSFLVSMFISSWLAERIGSEWVLVSAAVLFIGVGLLGLVRSRRGDLVANT